MSIRTGDNGQILDIRPHWQLSLLLRIQNRGKVDCKETESEQRVRWNLLCSVILRILPGRNACACKVSLVRQLKSIGLVFKRS